MKNSEQATINLNGRWKLYWDLHSTNSERTTGLQNLPCIDAKVPGNVELDLQRAGLLPDLYFGDNIWKVQDFEHATWWYTRNFKVSPEFLKQDSEIIFSGLDCFADIWINDQHVGTSQNMLIDHSFAVACYLRPGLNSIVVRIKSALIEVRKRHYDACEIGIAPHNFESLGIRKAPHMFGWDIFPRLISAGIWRDVKIQPVCKDQISQVYYHIKEIGSDHAKILVRWQIKPCSHSLDKYTLSIKLACNNSKAQQQYKIYGVAGQAEIVIKNPKLWWPKGYGQAHLYLATITLLRDSKPVARREAKIGLRTIKLDTKLNNCDGAGSFTFYCNSKPIMIKGTNHVALDASHSQDRTRLLKALKLYDDIGCNMIRCWGGSVYEDHEFYDFCDKHGIMVWQDFAFACSQYPQNREFQDAVSKEVEFVTKKLRNHPCIVVWAGDNEVDHFAFCNGLDPEKNVITRHTIPAVLNRCDPYRAYLPSSPYYSREVIDAGIESAAEQHLWGPRDYYKGLFYANNKACFASEIGYHGCPSVDSIARFISKDKMWPPHDNQEWIAHATDPVKGGDYFKFRIKLMSDQIKLLFGSEPANLKDFVLASQITQAEALKYFIELFRSQKWSKSGILWWNLLDGWPQFSDAVVDYYFKKKLAYHYIKRVQVPFCVMITDPVNDYCKVVAANDTLQDTRGWFKIIDASSKRIILSGKFQVVQNENNVIDEIPIAPGQQSMFLIQYGIGRQLFGNHYLLGSPPFDLKQYTGWLKKISSLPEKFDVKQIVP